MSVDFYPWPYRTPGIPDHAFDRLAGIPLSPREVRVLILSQLRLRSKDCLWDIGAGTGTIAVEAGLLCPEGKILAIERDSEVGELIQRNCAKFSVLNVTVCQGNAPECLADLHPLPNRICLEGGQSLSSLLEETWSYLQSGGRLVAIATSLEALNALSMALSTVQARQVEVSQALVNRLEQRGKGQSFVSMDPVFILSGEKGD